jgi:heme/copper-type cytochrome/quinol oxidase subunit 3
MTDVAISIHSAHSAPRRQRAIVPTTRLGMWWFLCSEIVTFGGVVVSYALLRLYHPEWLEHSSHTLLPIGAINTVILLTSSLTIVLAHQTADQKQIAVTRKWLLITLGLGLLFLAFKAFEYHHEISNGRTPGAGVFWGFYYAMTGLHALHVIAGLVLMTYLVIFLNDPKVLARVTPAGLYWHFVDIVWIFLFPLLYVTSH